MQLCKKEIDIVRLVTLTGSRLTLFGLVTLLDIGYSGSLAVGIQPVSQESAGTAYQQQAWYLEGR